MKTVVIRDYDLTYAVEALLSGGLVGVPTETVYGLAGNGLDASAVSRIYEVKGRPEVKPLSLLVPDIEVAATVCAGIPKSARLLAEAFWPGPLTIVLPCRNTVPHIVTARGNTIGVRCPDHPLTLALLRTAGIPAAAPSANLSGMPSPKCAEDVLSYFDGKINCIIDGGRCRLGVESTIVSLIAQPYKILRQGALPEEKIKQILESDRGS